MLIRRDYLYHFRKLAVTKEKELISMEIVEIIAEVLKYVLPAAIVLLAVRYMNGSRIEQERMNGSLDIRKDMLRTHLPLKLAAYERAVLYLERINPQSLLARTGNAGKSAPQLHLELVREIRMEYDHNLVQQIYISTKGWAALVKAKEEILTLVNQCGREVGEAGDAMTLSRRILESYSERDYDPSLFAINVLKEDIDALFRV